MAINQFKDVKICGDCDVFELHYTPLDSHGKPQVVRLDAESEENARFEAAGMLDCSEDELPETEWA